MHLQLDHFWAISAYFDTTRRCGLCVAVGPHSWWSTITLRCGAGPFNSEKTAGSEVLLIMTWPKLWHQKKITRIWWFWCDSILINATQSSSCLVKLGSFETVFQEVPQTMQFIPERVAAGMDLRTIKSSTAADVSWVIFWISIDIGFKLANLEEPSNLLDHEWFCPFRNWACCVGLQWLSVVCRPSVPLSDFCTRWNYANWIPSWGVNVFNQSSWAFFLVKSLPPKNRGKFDRSDISNGPPARFPCWFHPRGFFWLYSHVKYFSIHTFGMNNQKNGPFPSISKCPYFFELFGNSQPTKHI